MIHGKSESLHGFKQGTTIHNFEGGSYHKTAKLADKTHGIKEDWSAEDVDALLEQALEAIENGLTEEQLDEAQTIAESLQEEFEGLDEAEAYSIAVASVTGIDLEEAEIEINEFLKELDFHITSRKKANLIDLVEELESKKQVYKERLDKLSQLKNDIKNNSISDLDHSCE